MSEASPGPWPLLDLEQLRTALDGVVDLAIARFGPRLDLREVGHDYYWHLPVQAAFTMSDDPGLRIDAGMSSDDLEEMQDMVENPQDQFLWHCATHLSEVLRLLAFADHAAPPPAQATPEPISPQPMPPAARTRCRRRPRRPPARRGALGMSSPSPGSPSAPALPSSSSPELRCARAGSARDGRCSLL